MSPRLSVIICSLNGASGVGRCLRALNAQTIRSSLEVIVVDDGSTDETSEVARAHGAALIRHIVNRGTSTGRNSGVRLASAPIIAFLDDDCEPDPRWAEELLAGYDEHTIAIGGPLLVGGDGFVLGYLARHNPLSPQEMDLAASDQISYRLYLYLRRQWTLPKHAGRRQVFSFPSANMSVRRQEFLQVGGFDERIHFNSEDDDLCRRLRIAFPEKLLIFIPGATVIHHFTPSIRDTLRRRRAYGQGAARMYRKWQEVPPTFFPWPLVMLAILTLSIYFPPLVVVAALLPYLFYPAGLRTAITLRRADSLFDAYLQLAEECCGDLGFIEGLWRFRKVVPDFLVSPQVRDNWEMDSP